MTYDTRICTTSQAATLIERMVTEGWEPFLMAGGDWQVVIVFRRTKAGDKA